MKMLGCLRILVRLRWRGLYATDKAGVGQGANRRLNHGNKKNTEAKELGYIKPSGEANISEYIRNLIINDRR